MMYPLYKQHLNNLERQYSAKSYAVDAVISTDDGIRGLGDTYIQPGDELIIGTIPGGSMVLGMQVITGAPGFSATDAKFDFYLTSGCEEGSDNCAPGGVWDLEIALDVDVSEATAGDKTIHIDLPTAGQINGNGMALGSQTDTRDYYIIAVYKGAESTSGSMNVLFEYARFANNVGAY